jgi:CRP-like cAMP-binding protein
MAGWVATLPADVAAALRERSTSIACRRGQRIFGPTRAPEHVYLLEEGVVRLFRLSADGGEVILGYVRPGELFGEVSVITDRPRETFAECRATARVLRIPRGLFVQTVQANSAVLYELTKRIGERVRRYQSRLEDLVLRNARTRLALTLVRLLDEAATSGAAPGRLGFPLTQEELARLIGTTRQTVNIMLSEFADSGLVRRVGRDLHVGDPDGLRAIASG